LDCFNPTAHDLRVFHAAKGLHNNLGRPFEWIVVCLENVQISEAAQV
jgi:hypothetical protein